MTLLERPHDINPQRIITLLRERGEEIFGGRGIVAAYLYGSVATGGFHPYSDVDIALVLDEETFADLTPYQRLHFELDMEIRIETLTGIDYTEVRVINDAPLKFRGQVACEGIRIYCGDEGRRAEFEIKTWKEYFDYTPYLQMMRQAFWERLNERMRQRA